MQNTNDFLNWDEYFMALAEISALKSKDPNTKVGACLVDENNKIVSLGYNGMPIGCKDSEMPWGNSSENYFDNKYPFVCHAELNAILNAFGKQVIGCKIYTTLFPCNECAKAIIQIGVKTVIYGEDKYKDENSTKAAKHMFKKANINFLQYKKTGKNIKIKV